MPGPRLVAAGEFICSSDGTWDHLNIPLDWAKSLDMLADGIEAVREIVRRRVRKGANWIKVGLSKGHVDDQYHPWGDDPMKQVASYSLEEVRALVDEAHRNKLKVSAHCIGDEAVRMALDGGVDIIEHGYGIEEDTRKRLVDENALVVSTIAQLYFHEQAAEPFHYPGWLQDVSFKRISTGMRHDFELSLRAGVRYALGTDLIGFPDASAERRCQGVRARSPMGAWIHDKPSWPGRSISAEALSMAARDRLSGEGTHLADIIGVPADPERDITTLQNVNFVMFGGDVIVDKATAGSGVALTRREIEARDGSGADMAPKIVVDNLAAGYGSGFVLEGISFDVSQGEIVCLIRRQRLRQDDAAQHRGGSWCPISREP